MSANAAFGAVALTAAVSVLAALHVNVSIVAILGLIGAYLAPNLLTGAQDRSGFFMGYLAVLGLVAVGLGQLRLRWVLLRWVALVGSYLWLVIWWNAAGRSNAYHALAMTAAIGFAGLFVLEAAMALSRAGAADDSWAGAPSAEFFGIRIDTGPIEAHVIVASMLAIVGSMLHLLWTWNGAAATHIALAATVMAALLAGPGLVLNYLRPMWAAVRWVVLLISYGWLALWWQDAGRALGQESLAILWALGLYALFLLESVLALRRWSGKILVEAPEPAPPRLLDAQVAAASLLATAGTMGLLLWVWGSTDPVLLGTIALVLAAVQAGAALLARSRDFYISSALQSAALVTLAAPLLLDEFAVTLAWMLLAAALALAAWQLNLPRARVWAAILLVLALGRLVLVDFRDPVLRAVQFHVFDQAVTRWLLAGWTIALLYHLLAWLRPGAGKWPALQQWIDQRIPPAVRPQPVVEPARAAPAVLDYASHALRAIAATGPQPGRYDRAGVLFAAVGTLLFAALTLSRWSGPPATLALILWLAGLLLLSRQGERIGYLAQTWVLGALISLRWLVFDNLIPLVQTWNSGGEVLAVLNVPALCGVLLAAAVVAGLRWAPPSPAWARAGEPDGDESIRNVLAVWAVVIVFALLNFETIRYIDTIAGLGDRAIVKQVALSVLWALVGFGAVIFGFHRQVAPVRWAALALLGITLAKILVVDMSEVRAIWRILSFVAVGALLLGVSFVYHKQVEARATR